MITAEVDVLFVSGKVLIICEIVNAVVDVAGIVCDFRLGYGKVLSRKSKVIAINRSRDQLYKVIKNNTSRHDLLYRVISNTLTVHLVTVCCCCLHRQILHRLFRGYYTAVFISTRISRSSVDYQPKATAEG